MRSCRPREQPHPKRRLRCGLELLHLITSRAPNAQVTGSQAERAYHTYKLLDLIFCHDMLLFCL